jgi:hypothetical protein
MVNYLTPLPNTNWLRAGLLILTIGCGVGVSPKLSEATICCPRCSCSCCKLKVDEGEHEKYCWEIECKEICVPRVVFPWQNPGLCRSEGCHAGRRAGGCDGCEGCSSCAGGGCGGRCVKHNGAFVVKVKIPKKHKYKCPKCEYEWEAVRKGRCCRGSGCGCPDGRCDGSCCQHEIDEDHSALVVDSDTMESSSTTDLMPVSHVRDDVIPAAPSSDSQSDSPSTTPSKWRIPFFHVLYDSAK